MRGLRLCMDENRIRFIQDLLQPDRTKGGRLYSTSKMRVLAVIRFVLRVAMLIAIVVSLKRE